MFFKDVQQISQIKSKMIVLWVDQKQPPLDTLARNHQHKPTAADGALIVVCWRLLTGQGHHLLRRHIWLMLTHVTLLECALLLRHVHGTTTRYPKSRHDEHRCQNMTNTSQRVFWWPLMVGDNRWGVGSWTWFHAQVCQKIYILKQRLYFTWWKQVYLSVFHHHNLIKRAFF